MCYILKKRNFFTDDVFRASILSRNAEMRRSIGFLGHKHKIILIIWTVRPEQLGLRAVPFHRLLNVVFYKF
jgi:hypothetical protein